MFVIKKKRKLSLNPHILILYKFIVLKFDFKSIIFYPCLKYHIKILYINQKYMDKMVKTIKSLSNI